MEESRKPGRRDYRLHRFEIILLSIVFVVAIGGLIAALKDVKWFEEVYAREDGLIENFTVVPLSVAVVVTIGYLLKTGRRRSWMFKVVMIMTALFSFFVAGEEISWGQRIFNIESTEFFRANNAQQETNLHNLVVSGKKVNKIVFSLLLSIIIGLYLLVLPVLYSKSRKVKKFTNWAGIPVPRVIQIFSAILLFILTGLIPSTKNAEILEMGITSIFLLILLYPGNEHVFRGDKPLNGPKS